jgi:uncharacterized protein
MGLNEILLFATIVMCTYFIEGLIGFGGTIMALPLASAVIGLKLTVPIMTIVVLIASLIIAIRDFKYINKKEFSKITLLMIVGLPIGMWLFDFLPEKPLKVLLGVFMIVVAVKGLFDEGRFKKEVTKEKVNNKTTNMINSIILFLGGIIHGAFTCGGPFVVIYATKNIKDKSSFRATLCALWATLNAIMITIDALNGEITGDIITISVITMIFVTIAIIISNIVHKKIKGESFTKFVYVALFISGILMMM